MTTYVPTDKQIDAHCAPEQFLGFGGAMGGGKSRWLCEAAKQFSVLFPGNFGVISRQSGVVLRVSTMEVFFNEVLPEGGDEWRALGCHMNHSEGILEFRALNPVSKIWFTGLDNDNVERIKSLNLGFFGIDEATEVSESIYLMLCTRLRRAGIPREFRKGMITANPEAGWVKRRFVDQALPNHRFVFANYLDNPHLPSDYSALFETMPLRWRQKYLNGSWAAASGLIFKEFNPTFHVIPYRESLPGWKYVRGLDHGSQNPTACVGLYYGEPSKDELTDILGDRIQAMHPLFKDYPVILAHRLYYGPGLISAHKEGIAETFIGTPLSVPTFADPSIWSSHGHEKLTMGGKSEEWTIYDDYSSEPKAVLGLTRGNNQLLAGLDRVSTLLLIGHLFFMNHPSLEPLIGAAGEIRSYAWKESRTDDVNSPEEPINANDHACDALRYALMSLPPIVKLEQKIVPYNSFQAARLRAQKFKRELKGKMGVRVDKHGFLRSV
jgi:hypothetical protein